MTANQNQNREPERAYIGLGSNEGDRVGFVQQAMQLLKDIRRIEVVECSSLYETKPLADNSGHWYVNAVVAVDTSLMPEELLDVCKDIEARLKELHGQGRKNGSCTGKRSRIIDLDLLFFGQDIVQTNYLTIPHPFVHERAYALVPLLEIAPDITHPLLQRTVSELHESLEEPELVFLYGTRGLETDLDCQEQ